jgi:hypothetical protein
MAGIMDYLLGYTSPAQPESSAVPAPAQDVGWFDKLTSKMPGAQYLTPDERQGAIGLALLRAGAAGLQSAQGAPGRPATIGSTFGAMAQGFGEGVHGMGDQAIKSAMISAQMAGKQKGLLEAQQLMRRNAAIEAYARGDRSPEVLALINPDKAVEQGYKADEHLASMGLTRDASGRVVALPGYEEALARQAEAKGAGTPVPVVPGGKAVRIPYAAPGGGVPAAQVPSVASVTQSSPVGVIVSSAAKQAGVDGDLFSRLIQAESGFDPKAVSPKGAQGLGQLMPDTAKARGVTNPYDAQQNATAAAQEFRSLQDKYKDPTLAVMAYNWGQGNVDTWLQQGADPRAVPAETLGHVRKVLGPQAQPPQAQQTNSPNPAGVNYIYGPDGRPVGVQSNDTASENTFDKTTGESLGKLFITKQEAVSASRQSAAKMQAIADILKGIETGKGSEALLEGKRSLKALGVDLNAIGLTDNVGAQDAARALANEMSLELRNPAGGAGMPGAMSDPDRVFLQSMAGGLSMTPQGRSLLLEARKRTADRSAEEGKIVRDYARTHGGRLDIGVYDELDKLAAKPIFDQNFMQKAQSLSGGGSPAAAPGAPAGGGTLRWNPRTRRVE